MDEIIARLNIKHYRKVLATERDPERRRLISRLFAEEQSNLAAAAHRRPADRNAHEGVSRLNLEYYRRRLETETDLVIRQVLLRLIADEEAGMAPPNVQTACGED